MKKLFSDIRIVFSLLVGISIMAASIGAFLSFLLCQGADMSVRMLAVGGQTLWQGAWIVFARLCLRLRKGESAFTPATGKALTIIGWCMVSLAAVSFAAALINGALGRGRDPLLLLVETVLLPGFFLAVGVVAKVLQGLLAHAMSIEKEQEGVV